MINFLPRLADAQLLHHLDFKCPSTWIASWFGSGLIRPAPGTWGTLGGMIIAAPLLYYTGAIGLFLAAIILFIAGLWASKKFSYATATKDSSHIVIDEVVGLLITLIPAQASISQLVIGFILFRFFDIIKPYPIKLIERHFPNAFGVMIDDVIAGIMAGICLLFINYFQILS